MPPQKQRDKALETMEVYAPLAHRLGIRSRQGGAGGYLPCAILDPVAYAGDRVASWTCARTSGSSFYRCIQERITERLNAEGHATSIWRAGSRASTASTARCICRAEHFEEIYDVYAVRVIVDTVTECYNVLGVIHDMFRPIPNRFKDYISTPKPNMYQSLHTTVLDKEGIPFEMQIRTWEMHYTAEYGIAAHWKYKAGISGQGQAWKSGWPGCVSCWKSSRRADDAEDIVRTDQDRYCRRRKCLSLPQRATLSACRPASTVIDFAYAIHSAVGNRMIGAKVDGRIVPHRHRGEDRHDH